jgi:hypothetical protein
LGRQEIVPFGAIARLKVAFCPYNQSDRFSLSAV